MAMRLVAILLLAVSASAAAAQERLVVGPGHTLRLHAAPGPDKPVSASYALDLAPGDWIVVVAPAAQVGGASTEPAITLSGPNGAASAEHGRLVHRAASAGTYRLAVRQFHALSVTRYPAGHPVVEPGITPGEIKLAAGTLGAVSMAIEPMEPSYPDVPPPSGTPARVAVQIGDAITIHLYRRDALRQMALWADDPAPRVAVLLAGNGPIEAGLDLPAYPVGNFSVTYVTRPERVRGVCFSFLRYIARWTQEEVYPFDTLTYVALGLSRDGRWFAVVTAATTPAAVPGQPTGLRDGRSASYEAALTRRIAGEAKALSPGIAALDAVAASLTLPCGTP